jgi:K+-transporting ATPase ATPase B chain
MSQVETLPQAPQTDSDDVVLSRLSTRRTGLFDPHMLKAALFQSFVMLRPDIQWKNPVMFVVEVGTVLTILFTVLAGLGIEHPERFLYFLALDVWLLLTILFANFATALAEARGKAQTESLRRTRQETPAFRLWRHQDVERVLALLPAPSSYTCPVILSHLDLRGRGTSRDLTLCRMVWK